MKNIQVCKRLNRILEILKNTIKQNFRITKKSFPTVFTFEILTQCINKSLKSGGFPDYLKQANISPIFKKDDPSDKDNYKCKKNYLIIDCLTM